MKKVTVWLDEKYAGVLTVTAVGNEAIRTNVAVAGTALEDADVIIIRPGGDIRYEKEGDYPSGPAGHLPKASRGRLALREGEAGETDAVNCGGCSECALKRSGRCFEWMEHMEMGGKA